MGEKATTRWQMYLNDVFTIPVNLAGLPGHRRSPAASPGPGCRSGCSSSARRSTRPTLLRVAHAYQTVTDWHTRRPARDYCRPVSRTPR